MASNIRLNPDELEGYAKKYNAEAENIHQAVQDATSATENLADLWEGEAFVAFYDQFEELRPSMMEMVELLHKIERQLVSTADALRTADSDIANQIRG